MSFVLFFLFLVEELFIIILMKGLKYTINIYVINHRARASFGIVDVH
jgi:hypothetical protein